MRQTDDENKFERELTAMDLIRHNWKDLAFDAGVILFVIILMKFVIINFNIPSESMVPTLNVGDRLIGNRISYTLGHKEIKRGDIVLFNHPEYGKKVLIKRVIGLPGETISFDGESVYVTSSPCNCRRQSDRGFHAAVAGSVVLMNYHCSSFTMTPQSLWRSVKTPKLSLGIYGILCNIIYPLA